MKLTSVEGNTQRLDGGSLFGNAPKAMWSKWTDPDDLNRIPLACRSLLVETDDNRKILFDVGIGSFFEPKLRKRFGVMEEEHLLLKNLNMLGIGERDIDAIVLSHLHFDHAGGLLSPYSEGPPRLLFPNATYYLGSAHWKRALSPTLRDRASFLPHLHQLLEESGRVRFIDGENHPDLDFGLTFISVDGHTIGSLLARFELPTGPLLFVADLAPGLAWLHLPITMGYDRFPELVVEEKTAIFDDLFASGGSCFFTHDPEVPCARLLKNEKGRYYGEPTELGDLLLTTK